MAQQDILISINEASKLLGVTKLTLRNWDKAGKLKAVRIGARGDRRYHRKDVEMLASKNVAPEPVDEALLEKYLASNTFWTEEAPGLPITLELGVREMTGIHRYFKPGLSHCIFGYEGEQMKQYLSVEESIATCEEQLKTLHEEPEKIKKFIDECKEQFAEFGALITKFNFLPLEDLSNTELNDAWAEFNRALIKFWEPTLVVEPYSPYLDHVYVPKFEKEVGDKKRAHEVLPDLSIPTELSFVSQERRDLLRMITKHLDSARERDVLLTSSNADYLARLKLSGSPFLDALYKHQQDYFWIQNSYGHWQTLTVQNFLNFIREIVAQQPLSDLKKELQLMEDTHVLEARQLETEKALRLSEATIKELEFLRTVVWIKDERKHYVLRMLHVLFGFLAEYARRANVPARTLAFAAVHELPAILAQEFDLDILEQRMQKSIQVTQSGDRISYLTGNEATLLNARLTDPHVNDVHESIHGSIACKGGAGLIEGVVRVILDPRKGVINDGDILVTSMTRPEFIPLMRKARAVITDEGGITCHAAIVSREMNKPCIIGTRIATKVFKDGDKIEMRMNHGIIKVL